MGFRVWGWANDFLGLIAARAEGGVVGDSAPGMLTPIVLESPPVEPGPCGSVWTFRFRDDGFWVAGRLLCERRFFSEACPARVPHSERGSCSSTTVNPRRIA